jgi:hypothetical protein
VKRLSIIDSIIRLFNDALELEGVWKEEFRDYFKVGGTFPICA